MAERLLQFIRPSDTLARLGGDEFVIVAEDLPDEREAVTLGERIAEAGRKPFRIGTEEFVCTVSVGIATTSDAHHVPDSLLQEADLALYRAKDRGRDRAEVFDEDLRTTAVGRLGTERMLRRAIDEERLGVRYQPIIDLSTGRVVSVEALVRILDPELGVLEPDSFLTVAEETGLLATMDEWVFGRALEEATGWTERLGVTDSPCLNLNVTSRRVADASFYDAVTVALDSRGLSRNTMKVEVTERVLMEASNSALAGLRALRDGGSGWAWTTSERGSRRSPICGSSRSTSSRSTGRSSTGSIAGRGRTRSSTRSSVSPTRSGWRSLRRASRRPSSWSSSPNSAVTRRRASSSPNPAQPDAVDELVLAGGYRQN